MPLRGDSEKNERRARWAMERYIARPTIRRVEMLAMVRKEFECGKTAAELSLKRCAELMKSYTAELVENFQSTLVAHSLEDAENARNRGDLRTANKIRMDLAHALGIAKPDEISITHRRKYDELEDHEIDALTKLDDGESIAEH